jgi:hypothetical protein
LFTIRRGLNPNIESATKGRRTKDWG